MRLCPRCGARYEAPAQYCQRDGAALQVETGERDPYLGAVLAGAFHLEKVLGSGGMGVVYAANDEKLKRRVAVKILHRDLVSNRDVVQRFHREAQIASQLDHPNIVRLFWFDQLPDGNLYLVLEFLEGPTLLQTIEQAGALAPARAVHIIGGIADAIGYAHRRDIIHRDLKPENVILVQRDEDPEHPKVLDFGIAKMLVGSDTLVTQAGLIFGTAKYISPEGAQGDAVDKRSDVYSLGIIAYQALSGETPFDAAEPVQLLMKHIHETPPPLHTRKRAAGVPRSLEHVVMRALSKFPDARYPDASAFARALREALDVAPTGTGARPAPFPLASAAPAAAISSAPAVLISAPAPLPTQGPSSVLAPIPVFQEPASAPGTRTMVGGSPAEARAQAAPAPAPNMAPHGNNGRVYMNAVAAPAVEPPMQMPVSTAPVADFTLGAPGTTSDPYALRTDPHASSQVIAPAEEDLEIPGLSKKRNQRSLVPAVLAAIVATLLLGLGGAYLFRMFPSQRREAELQSFLHRAEDAYRLSRYEHGTPENVEDLTNTILLLSPGNARARQLRAAAAMALRNAAVDRRNAGHPADALPLLQSAMRLAEDRRELETLRSSIEAEVNAQETITVPTRIPPTTPTTQPTTPRTQPRTNPNPTPRVGTPTPPPTQQPDADTTPPVTGPTFTPGRDPALSPPDPQHNNPPPPDPNTPPQVVIPTPPPDPLPPPHVVQPPPVVPPDPGEQF